VVTVYPGIHVKAVFVDTVVEDAGAVD